VSTEEEDRSDNSPTRTATEADGPRRNVFLQAIARENLRPLLASAMVPTLWSAGFYLSFVWMAIFMKDLIAPPVPGAFAVNSASLLCSVCVFFPVAGMLSDRCGRVRTMSVGGTMLGILGPVAVLVIGRGSAFPAFAAQSLLGVALSLFGAPMCAWLAEAFEPEARLTSISIGYNIAQAVAGGSVPFLATELVERLGPASPGWILTALAVLAMAGLHCVAPAPPPHSQPGTSGGGSPPTTSALFAPVPTTAMGALQSNDVENVENAHAQLRPIIMDDDDDDSNELL
jgi:MFS transporter, MHS family, proline/betaine transporter